MNFEQKALTLAGLATEKADTLLVLVPQAFEAGADALSALIAQALKTGDLEAKTGQFLSAYRVAGVSSARVVLAWVGSGAASEVSKAVTAAVTAIQATPALQLTVSFIDVPQAGAVRAAVLAVAAASYVFTATLSKPQPRKLRQLRVTTPDIGASGLEFTRACAVSTGVELAKEWANRPANHATPRMLAKAAQALAKHRGIDCEVLGPSQVAKLGMGAFMAVARGSDEPLQFIVLKYTGAGKTQAPTVLVGKGITFDTGGVSLKPAAEMDEMKFDMSGAASVLGVFRSLAELQPAVNVIGLIPACENMPDGRALKPGDVVTSMSGQTIEVLNTDAEGRLILCDALTYAERFKPQAVVDIATLTGACVIALGAVRSGMYASSDRLASDLMAAGESSLDLCWRMPLDDEYATGLKTNFADVANVAGRAGGSVVAAKFLQRFTEKFNWAHLDIAGTAWTSGKAKGATGRPVGLLVDYLLSQGPTEVAPAPTVKSTKRRSK